MAVSKAKKIEQVEKLGAELRSVKTAIVGSFSKLTVAQDFELRKSVRSAGAKYRVVKNTMVERAAKGTAIEAGLKEMAGVTYIAYTECEPGAMTKSPANIA